MQSILDVRWGNSEFSSMRMVRTLHVLLVPDYFALHIAPPYGTPLIQGNTPGLFYISISAKFISNFYTV